MKRRMSRKASSQVFLIILLILPLTVYYVVLHSKINNNNDVVLWKGAGSNNNDNEEEEDIRNLLITTSAYYDNNDNNAGIIINRTITTTTNNLDSTSNEKEKGGIIIISDTEVRNLFYLWNDALETLDPDIVTRRYSTKRRAATVLLPTGSNIPRTDYQSIRSYFVDFLKKKPTCKILDSHVYIQEGNGGRWCMDVGIYEFVFQTTGEKMKARYTFVYVFEKEEDDDGEWKILHHHSSVMPEEASETEETETDAVIVGGGDEDTERNNNIVVHETNNNLIPNNIIVGKTYNVNSTPCWLSPQWGSTSTTTTSNTTNSSYEEICLGSTISNPTTSARQLTCIHDNNNNNNNNNENLNKPQRRTRSDDTNNLTIGLLYYMKPSQLLRQIEMIQSYPIEIQRNLTLLIIDDCSPNGLTAYEYVKKILPQHFKIRIARILIDLQFNHGGARNLACYLSETSKIILLDLDLLIDNTMIQQLMEFQLVEEEASEEVVPEKPTLLTATATNNNNNNNASNMLHNVIPPPPQQQQRSIISVAHRFNRILPPQVTSKAGGGDNNNNNNNNIETRLHPAVMLLNVSTYWQNGGCDEDFVGSYGFTDMHYWYKWRMDYTRKKVVDHTEIYLKEFQIPGCNFTSLTKIQPSIDSILKAEGEGGSSSSEISIVDKCTKALMKLKQNKPKRKPKINNEKLKTKKISGCWSNRYLRFPWKLIL